MTTNLAKASFLERIRTDALSSFVFSDDMVVSTTLPSHVFFQCLDFIFYSFCVVPKVEVSETNSSFGES